MRTKLQIIPLEDIQPLILFISGKKVILDFDLARIYGVTTKVFNQAVKRNADRFPPDFLFRLTKSDTEFWHLSRSQTVTLKRGGNIKYRPYAFTEHGAMMAANILRSKRAIAMSIFIVRAFNEMRQMLENNKVLSEKLAELEKKLSGRLDDHQQAILQILKEIQKLAATSISKIEPREIGFHVKNVASNPIGKKK